MDWARCSHERRPHAQTGAFWLECKRHCRCQACAERLHFVRSPFDHKHGAWPVPLQLRLAHPVPTAPTISYPKPVCINLLQRCCAGQEATERSRRPKALLVAILPAVAWLASKLQVRKQVAHWLGSLRQLVSDGTRPSLLEAMLQYRAPLPLRHFIPS